MHPNEQLARSAYEAFNKKDIPTVMGVFSDDLKWFVPGNSVQSGRFDGKEGALRYFKIVGEFTKGNHTVEILDILANDERCVALLQAKGRHEDKVFDMTVIHLMQMSEGKLTDLKIIPTDQYAFDEFWS